MLAGREDPKEQQRSSPVVPTIATPPSRVELHVVNTAITRVVLKWKWPSSTLEPSVFHIERDGVEIGQTPGSSRRYVDSTTSFGTRYRYRVVAEIPGAEVSSRSLAAKTPVPPIERARLQGEYKVTYTVLSSNLGNAHPGDPVGAYTWRFAPNCADRACGGKWTILLKQGRAVGTFSFKASKYVGKMSGVSLGSCNGVDDTNDNATLDLEIARARVVDGVWAAVVFEGSYRQYFPSGNGCIAGFLRATVTGVSR